MNVEIEVLDDDITKRKELISKLFDGILIYPFYFLMINNFIDEEFDDKFEICTSLNIKKKHPIHKKSVEDLYFEIHTPLDAIKYLDMDNNTSIMNNLRFFVKHRCGCDTTIICCHKEDKELFINKINIYDDVNNIFEEYKFYKGYYNLKLYKFKNNRGGNI